MSLSRTLAMAIFLLAVVAVLFYISAFKLIDNDFWWHVKAGELMWNAGGLIRAEPFSYPLVDKPYGALHEWLAQIIFYLVYRSGGATLSILMRGAFAAATALVLLAVDRRSVLPNALLVLVAFYAHRPSLMVRPQLFTFFCFAVVLWLTLRYASLRVSECMRRSRRIFFASFLALQIVWVNLHGASAIFGVLCAGALFLESAVQWHLSGGSDRLQAWAELRFRSLFLGAVLLALFASPNGYETFVDMYMHRFDRTIPLVREWMPLRWSDYATDVLPYGVIAAALVALRRRSWLLCGTILLCLFILSLQSYRHCLIFVIACLGITFYQLATSHRWRSMLERASGFPILTYGGGIIAVLLLWLLMYRHDLTSVFRTNTFGFGVDIPVQGAVEFAEREKLRGTLFNTYNQGGYILYRCSPDCRVFADGRNIEYGYPFVQKLLDAGTNPVRWRELDREYRFTYAIVEYKSVQDYGMLLPYITHLQADPSWKLVYVDDDATVYVRDLPQYASVIQKHAYRIVTPSALEFTDVLASLSPEQWAIAEEELRRVTREHPESIKPRLILANRAFDQKRLDDAETIGLDAMRAQPYRPEVYELLGRISVERQDWTQAGDYLERAVVLSGQSGPQIDFGFLAMVFSRAGQNDKAEMYHNKALRAGQESRVVEE